MARNSKDYVNLAMTLSRKSSKRNASKRIELKDLHLALEHGRTQSPLFDIDSYVQSYEKLLTAAWNDFIYNGEDKYSSRTDLKTGDGDNLKSGLHHIVVASR